MWLNLQNMTASTHNHVTLMETLAVLGIVCVSHAAIGISANFHQTSLKKAGHPVRKSGQPGMWPAPWWIRLAQLGIGLLCLFIVNHFTTRQEKNWLCVWLVLMSITPIVGGALGYFGIKSPWLIHTFVIVLSAGCLVYYVMRMV